MGYVTREMIDRAKKMDLLTYLQTYEPQELVHFGGNTYCTREHDSLKISNGKWCWFSRGIGGKTALDYLIKVKELPFTEAVERIVGRAAERPSVFHARAQPEKPKTLLLPSKSNSNTRVIAYLKSRGIDGGLIEQCIRSGQLYESLPYHNAVFVGMDRNGTPRYAAIIRAVWGYSDYGSVKKLQVNMKNIRKKMGVTPGEKRYIINELGVGYRMLAEDEIVADSFL